MTNDLYKSPQSVLDLHDGLPFAAELIPDIFIQLNHGPVIHKILVARLLATVRIPRDDAITNNKFRSKAQAAISHLLGASLVERETKIGPLYLTDRGYDFVRKLRPEVLQNLSSKIEPKVKARGKVKSKPVWKPDLEVLRTLSERIETAKRGLPRQHPLEERAGGMAAKIIASLPDMPLDKLYVLWTNASKQESHSKQILRLAAPMLLDAIDKERRRRGLDAVSLLPNGEFFRWPSTIAKEGDGQLSFEADAFGVLALAGYRVGAKRGEPEAARWRTLSRLFQDEIAHAPAGDWGTRGSARRLKKLAYTIAALTRNAKRRGPQMDRAVSEWQTDLDHLHGRFYVGRFDFPWPKLRGR
ncbi:hypothetical protein ACFKHW_37605 [Bradyrhizobium lupini]|uniref:hypothetical protein n=1 Tax=Rhizobium lupini TaxID=136996 RepID=UPI00367078B7